MHPEFVPAPEEQRLVGIGRPEAPLRLALEIAAARNDGLGCARVFRGRMPARRAAAAHVPHADEPAPVHRSAPRYMSWSSACAANDAECSSDYRPRRRTETSRGPAAIRHECDHDSRDRHRCPMAYCATTKCSTRPRPNPCPGACTRANRRPGRRSRSTPRIARSRASTRRPRTASRSAGYRSARARRPWPHGPGLRGPGRAVAHLRQPAFCRGHADRPQDRRAARVRGRFRTWRRGAQVHRAPEHRQAPRVRPRARPLLPRQRVAGERVAALRAE